MERPPFVGACRCRRVRGYSEAEQPHEGPERPSLLGRLTWRKHTGRIGADHDDVGVRYAFCRDELIERGGVGEREANAAVRYRRAETGWSVP